MTPKQKRGGKGRKQFDRSIASLEARRTVLGRQAYLEIMAASRAGRKPQPARHTRRALKKLARTK